MKEAGESNAAAFAPAKDDVFARIARRYDLLCDLFSLGIHRLWKRRVVAMIAAGDWENMLDAAGGTGDITLRLLRRHPALAARAITVSDLSPAMLAIAERKAKDEGLALDFRVLNAEAMPQIPDASVDLYAISLALKICNRERVIREALRVLRPGGQFIALEASTIRMAWLHRLYLVYMNLCMPTIGYIATSGDASAYRYLLRGVSEFPDADALAFELRQAGFDSISYELMSLGIVAIHRGRKPLAGICSGLHSPTSG